MPTATDRSRPALPHPRLHWLVLPFAALIACAPLLRNGPSCGHDFDFHLLSWFEAAQQFAQGNLHPHWATLPAYGAGEPRFVFYPPISWTLGAVLTLALTHLQRVSYAACLDAIPILFTWIALATAGLSFFSLARRYTSPSAALLGAVLYLSNPYLLFTAYERTAFAELLSAAVLPLVIAAILPVADPAERPSIAHISIPLALLWLTNAPAAVIGSYTLGFVAVLRLFALRKTPRAAMSVVTRSAAGALLGLVLAGFYLVPAISEQRWVEIGLAVVPGMRPVDNTLFHHTADPEHDAVLRTASVIAVMLLTASAAALAGAFTSTRKETSLRPALPYLAALAAAVAILLTPASLPLWHFVPKLAFLQFPWRLLGVLAVVAALATAMLLDRVRPHVAIGVAVTVIIPAAIAVPAGSHFYQGCDTGEAPREALPALPRNNNIAPTDEYTPESADNDALRHDNPPFRLSPDPDSAISDGGQPGPAPLHLDLHLAAREFLILNLRDFPAWRVTVNGQLAPHGPRRDDGLLTVELPAGHDHLDLTYTQTRDQIAGDLLSVAGLITLAVMRKRQNSTQKKLSVSAPGNPPISSTLDDP